MSHGKLFVISGASGVGKSTVLKKVMESRKDLVFSVSATTRAPRPGEVDGVHYYFINRETFDEMIHNDEFLEYDIHFANAYGTPRAQVEEKLTRGSVILDIEPNGAMNVKEKCADATLIFIMPPSIEELEHRLRSRGDTSEEQVQIRLERAKWEIAQAPKYHYQVINGEVNTCADEILKIIADKAD